MAEMNTTATQTVQKAENVPSQSPKAPEIHAVGAELAARQNDIATLAPRRKVLETDLAQLRSLYPHMKVDSLAAELAALDAKNGAFESNVKLLEARLKSLMAEAEAEARKLEEEKAAKEAQSKTQQAQPKPAARISPLVKVAAAAVGVAVLERALRPWPNAPLRRGLTRNMGAYRTLKGTVVNEGPAPWPVRGNRLLPGGRTHRVGVLPLAAMAGFAGTLAAFSAVAAMAAPSSSSSSPSPAPGG